MESDSTDLPGLSPRIDGVISSSVRDLVDGFKVRRVLPSAKRRMVGPFVFLDQMGPEILTNGGGLDVAPHPHIGLATVTYMFEGELTHRDSLGVEQVIRPGDVNWMTAGRGIVHSERSPASQRVGGQPIFGLQSWVALPRDREEIAPGFAHHPVSSLPTGDSDGARLRVIAGEMLGLRSPVATLSEMFYADLELDPFSSFEFPPGHEERAVYVAMGSVAEKKSETFFTEGNLLLLRPGASVTIASGNQSARVMLISGPPMDGPRHIFWNFVSSSRDRIEQAKDDWMSGRFDRVPGEMEWIPLPGSGPAIVRYP